jgi:hypothetical protein
LRGLHIVSYPENRLRQVAKHIFGLEEGENNVEVREVRRKSSNYAATHLATEVFFTSFVVSSSHPVSEGTIVWIKAAAPNRSPSWGFVTGTSAKNQDVIH